MTKEEARKTLCNGIPDHSFIPLEWEMVNTYSVSTGFKNSTRKVTKLICQHCLIEVTL